MMRRVSYIFVGAFVAIVLTLAAPAIAEVLTMKVARPKPGDAGCPSGVCINSVTCSSAVSTGWVLVDGYAKATFGWKLTDANDSVTAVDIDCETTNVSTTTAGSGYDVCAVVSTSAAGVSDMQCPHVWEVQNADADHARFVVENLNDRYLQCTFTCTGTPAAADLIYTELMLRSP